MELGECRAVRAGEGGFLSRYLRGLVLVPSSIALIAESEYGYNKEITKEELKEPISVLVNLTGNSDF